MAAQSVAITRPQPVVQDYLLALNLVDAGDVIQVNHLHMRAEEGVLLERGNSVRVDADLLKYAGTFIPEKQRVVIHAYSSSSGRVNCSREPSFDWSSTKLRTVSCLDGSNPLKAEIRRCSDSSSPRPSKDE